MGAALPQPGARRGVLDTRHENKLESPMSKEAHLPASRYAIVGLVYWLLAVIAPALADSPGPDFADAAEDPVFDTFTGIARVTRGEEVLFEVARGTDRSGKPIDENTLFWIGSISKQFVGAAAVRLASQKKLRLTDPVAKHIPGWPADALRREGVDCTVDLLLSHQCGMPRQLSQRSKYQGHSHDPAREAALLERLNGMELEFTPGTDRQYSNAGFNLGGILVSKVSQMPLEDYLKQEFFKPLGMENTGNNPASLDNFRPRLAPGHLLTLFGPTRSDRWGWIPPELPSQVGAAGNIYSSAAEVEQWNRGLFQDGQLTPAEAEELTRSRRDDRDYGLGITKKKKSYGHRIAHNGALSPHGYSSFAGYVPETDTLVVVLQNQDLSINDPDNMALELLKIAHGDSSEGLADPVDTITKVLGAFLGSLLVATSSGLVVLLLLRALFPMAKTQFKWCNYHLSSAWFGVYFNHGLGANLISIDLLALGLYGLTLPLGLHRLGARPLYQSYRKSAINIGFQLLVMTGLAYYLGFLVVHFLWTGVALGITAAVFKVFEYKQQQPHPSKG
jgi:CubicO group peptidase (beta-lactamase class C family)